MKRYQVLTEALINRIAKSDDRDEYLILEAHPDFKGQWLVQSLNPRFFFDFEDLIGSYRAVSPATLDKFLSRAEGLGMRVAFEEAPEGILEAYEGLNDPPSIRVHSAFPNTIQGLLPFQLQGFNFLKDLDSGVALWSTGTGKTVLAAALIKYHAKLADFDLAWFVVKSHNKINVQRALSRLADIDSVVIDGPKKRREQIFADIEQLKPGSVIVTNYEKFRVDHEAIQSLFENRRVLLIWDEMPTKLKTRNTKLYKSVRSCLYQGRSVHEASLRPSTARQYLLSATPIENSPEDFYNCMRLIAPEVYGTIDEFRNEYVAQYSWFSAHQPASWHHLDRMGLRAAHVVHQVDKSDPDIAKQFPKVIEEPHYIDWDPKDRALYDRVVTKARENLEEGSILASISVLQMLCNAPAMVTLSASFYEAYERAYKAFSESEDDGVREPIKRGSELAQALIKEHGPLLADTNHTKLEALHQLLRDHAKEKVLIFSHFNEGLMPILEDKLRQWRVEYVRYNGTTTQKQAAQDRFTSDPRIQVFLSSDQGSDSLSLEAASVVIHFDLPWKFSTLTQRQNRVHRVSSEFDRVRYYTLMMADSIEDRKAEIIEQKRQYQEQIFNGVIADQSTSARLTKEDLLYILGI